MDIIKRIDNIVKDISKTTPGGNIFFDELDSRIKTPKNLDIIVKLFEKIYSKFGLDYNLVVSGGFGDLVMFLLKRGDIKCKGTVLQVSGGLTSHFTDMNKIKKVKEVNIQKQSDDINNKDFIFVDDSFYSGTTGYSIDQFLKRLGSKILKTYVIYDGNDTKSSNRIALYNYYDWNTGSQRTIDELMSELDRYKDIPRDIFEDRIIKGRIISIIQLRKEINEFKVKSGNQGIDIYSRIRESKILNFQKFNETKGLVSSDAKSKSHYFGYGWIEVNLNALRAWKYKLKNGFNCVVLLRKNSGYPGETYIIYLEEPDESMNFMDYMDHPSFYKNTFRKGPDFAIYICENQLDYYDSIKKFPTEEEIKNCLHIFSDEDLEVYSGIKYGYAYKISNENDYDLATYHKSVFSNDFICAFILSETGNIKITEDSVKKMIKEFELLLNFEYDYNLKVSYFLDSRGLVIILKNN